MPSLFPARTKIRSARELLHVDPECPGSGRDPEERRVAGEHCMLGEKMLDKTLADSFPASDPSSCMPDPCAEDSLIPKVPDLNRCANPPCTAVFKRLGDGRLFVEEVDDPVAWGLPVGRRQKVIWLCAACAIHFEVVLDTRTRQIIVRSQGRARKMAA
jgi:hypothetical protein